MKRNGKVPYFDTTATVDVEIDPEDLHDGGWHHESECGGTDPQVVTPRFVGGVSYQDAIASLHRQAHPAQLDDPSACREEPCRSLRHEQLAQPMGRTA